jgi:DNA-binding Lrp family transcriptional regulator
MASDTVSQKQTKGNLRILKSDSSQLAKNPMASCKWVLAMIPMARSALRKKNYVKARQLAKMLGLEGPSAVSRAGQVLSVMPEWEKYACSTMRPTWQRVTGSDPAEGLIRPVINSLTNKILEILWDEGPLTPLQIAFRLIGEKPAAVNRQLGKMVNDSILVRPVMGLYKLPYQDSTKAERFLRKKPARIKEHLMKIRWHIEESLTSEEDFYSTPNELESDDESISEFPAPIDDSILQVLWDSGPTHFVEIAANLLGKHDPIYCTRRLRHMTKRGVIRGTGSSIYYLPHQVYSIEFIDVSESTQSKRKKPAKQVREEIDTSASRKIPIPNLVRRVFSCLLESDRMSADDLTLSCKTTRKAMKRTINPLVDCIILERDESGHLRFAPQYDPRRISLVRKIVHNGWGEAIKILTIDYAKAKMMSTGKPLFRIDRLKKHIREEIPFLQSTELRPMIKGVLDALLEQETITQLDGSIYRFNSSDSTVNADTIPTTPLSSPFHN